MTSRELANKISRLVDIKITLDQAVQGGYDPAQSEQELELVLREIADAFKRLDHNPGVYYGEEPIK